MFFRGFWGIFIIRKSTKNLTKSRKTEGYLFKEPSRVKTWVAGVFLTNWGLIGQAWSHQRFHGPPERFFSHWIEAIKGPLWPEFLSHQLPPSSPQSLRFTLLLPDSYTVHSYLIASFTADVLRARTGRATSHKRLVDPFVQHRRIPSPFYFIQPTPVHHTRIPEIRCSDASKRTISARFQTDSHWAVGGRKASSSSLDVGSILSKCGFFSLKGLLQADELQASILMSLADVCYTMRLIITIDQVEQLDGGTSLCLFVPDHICLGFWVGMPVVSLQGFRCKHALLLLLFKPLDPVVYITGSISDVDRQLESAEISHSQHIFLFRMSLGRSLKRRSHQFKSRPFFLVQTSAGAKTTRSTSDHANIPPFVSH
ncbi:hypothetical protein VP01_386g6 [Puccinia sorghi]|uniref:Uncharacterized protein n=1 Tax=Puccinia sorghi TaxID=27349 RepID=A0A0L6UTT0_9BASI|nr:hypothetical protein VP01_386g6 [Puccinia sorghi]